MTMITAMMMTVTMLVTVTVVPGIYWASNEAEELYLEQEMELLRDLLEQRNAWVLRHLGCALGALMLAWIAQSSPGLEVPAQLADALAAYLVSSLLFAVLESLVAQKIFRMLASVPVRVSGRYQR